MTREEALRYIKSAAGHLIVTDRKVVGMALLEAWDALRQPGWVRTADRMPENGDDVLVCYDDEITIGCYVGNRWYYVITRDLEYKADIWGRVKYWMPLPPLPENAGVEGTKINGLKGESE